MSDKKHEYILTITDDKGEVIKLPWEAQETPVDTPESSINYVIVFDDETKKLEFHNKVHPTKLSFRLDKFTQESGMEITVFNGFDRKNKIDTDLICKYACQYLRDTIRVRAPYQRKE